MTFSLIFNEFRKCICTLYCCLYYYSHQFLYLSVQIIIIFILFDVKCWVAAYSFWILGDFVKCGGNQSVHSTFWCDGWPECTDNHADELFCNYLNIPIIHKEVRLLIYHLLV